MTSTAQAAAAGATGSDVLLEARDVRVHFSLRGGFGQRLLGRDAGAVKAVDGVSLSIRRGEVLGLVGESGSGKTTLARALLSLVPLSGGEVLLEGRTVSGLRESEFRPLRRRLQMVFQDPHASLNPAMTIGEAVGHPLRIHRLTAGAEETRAKVSAALERVGLAPASRYVDRLPSALSGGQKQRVVIARSIIVGPDLVVADEPVSMLDMSVRAQVLALMKDLRDDLGLTYIYVTHDLATAKLLCNRVAVMYLGRVVEIGPTPSVFGQPRHPYTKALLRAVPVPDPTRRVPRDLPQGEVPDAAVPPAGCRFHPRCPDAFGPCGWEGRDLQALLERDWAAMDPARFREESATVGPVSGAGTTALVPSPTGHRPEEALQVVEAHRRTAPDEPLWKGIEQVAVGPGGAEVRFHPGRDPGLVPVREDPSVEVACHLYPPD